MPCFRCANSARAKSFWRILGRPSTYPNEVRLGRECQRLESSGRFSFLHFAPVGIQVDSRKIRRTLGHARGGFRGPRGSGGKWIADRERSQSVTTLSARRRLEVSTWSRVLLALGFVRARGSSVVLVAGPVGAATWPCVVFCGLRELSGAAPEWWGDRRCTRPRSASGCAGARGSGRER